MTVHSNGFMWVCRVPKRISFFDVLLLTFCVVISPVEEVLEIWDWVWDSWMKGGSISNSRPRLGSLVATSGGSDARLYWNELCYRHSTVKRSTYSKISAVKRLTHRWHCKIGAIICENENETQYLSCWHQNHPVDMVSYLVTDEAHAALLP